MPMRAMYRKCLVSGLLAASLVGGTAEAERKTGLSMYVARKLGTVWPYKPARRWEAYLTVSKIAETLCWHTDSYGEVIASLQTETFSGYPQLFLRDQDGDGRADLFSYHENDINDFTREFGTFFSQRGDLRPFWVVFNGGLVPKISESGEVSGAVWYNYQFVDRNDDGAFDIFIVNDVDFDGDGESSGLETAWVFDDDFDGLVDRAENIIAGEAHEIVPTDGVLDLRRWSGPQHQSIQIGSPIDDFAAEIASDIERALGGEPEK